MRQGRAVLLVPEEAFAAHRHLLRSVKGVTWHRPLWRLGGPDDAQPDDVVLLCDSQATLTKVRHILAF